MSYRPTKATIGYESSGLLASQSAVIKQISNFFVQPMMVMNNQLRFSPSDWSGTFRVSYQAAVMVSILLLSTSASPIIFSQTMLEYPQAKKQDQVDALWDYEKYRPPFKEGDKYYYFKNDGLQNQNVLYESATAESEGRVLIDPNTWSDDGTVALGGVNFSDDGKYIAYGIQDAGSDWRTWKIMEVATGKLLGDKFATMINPSGDFILRYPKTAGIWSLPFGRARMIVIKSSLNLWRMQRVMMSMKSSRF